MAGDISRSSFNPLKHNSGVRMQQGRVQLDSDWNEQVDIATYYPRTAAMDLIGPSGAPVADAGFAISVQGGNLVVGTGRMYVNGILCENAQQVLVTGVEPTPTSSSSSSGSSSSGSSGSSGTPGPTVPLDPGMDIVTVAPTPMIAFAPENTLPGQPDLPGYTPSTEPGIYNVYLDVWERDITALQDPSILEIALGGVDTTTRTRIVWQVKTLQAFGTGCVAASDIAAWFPQSTGSMQAQTQPNSGASTPCAVPAQAGYTSLENQLYRIEVHTPGNAGTATFKWSRDNGSVVAAWQSQSDNADLIVSTLGRDAVLGFAPGQWVELTDDTHVLNGLPGVLVQLNNAEMSGQSPTLTIVVPSDPPLLDQFPLNPIVRRWDMPTGAVTITEGSWIDLENGVQVQFTAGGYYNTGDYWLVPARTATVMSSPTVIWPTDSSNNPLAQPPLGITHSYAPLATVSYDSTHGWTVNCDCRSIFAPAAQPSALHVIDVSLIQPSIELFNDTLVQLPNFLGGFKITCDGSIDPASVMLPTFFTTIDIPVIGTDTASSGLYPAAVPTKLMASVAVGDDENVSAFWIPTAQACSYDLNQMAILAAETLNNGEALVSITLKGNFIWSQACSSRLLNGTTFGIADIGLTLLNLPSGNGQRGGDFECWFKVPGYTDPNFPPNYVPFTSQYSIVGPDSTGDYVFIGEMSYPSLSQMDGLPLPDVAAHKLYSSPIEITPGVQVWAYVPTSAERTGDFSDFGLPLINPSTNAAFPGNIIPASSQPSSGIHALEAHVDEDIEKDIVIQPGAGGGIIFHPQSEAGTFAWRIRALYNPPSGYGYYGGYAGTGSGVGAELV